MVHRNGAHALIYAVRVQVVVKYLGHVLVTLSVLFAVPLLASLVYGEFHYTGRYAVVAGGCLLAGLVMMRRPVPRVVQVNEGMVVVSLAFLFTPLLAVYPLSAAGLPWVDIFFEAVSGVTSTGLTVMTDLAAQERTFLFARAWLQWFGGLGIAVFSIALVWHHHLAARPLMEPVTGEHFLTAAHVHARRSVVVYSALTVAGIAALALFGGVTFDGVVHVFSAVSTGGFSSLDGGVAALQPSGLVLWLAVLAFFGAVSLSLLWRVFHPGFRGGLADLELRLFVVLTVGVGVSLAVLLAVENGCSWPQAFRQGFILGVFAQTTTGFTPVDISRLSATAQGVLMMAMFIGGGVGSTAGGVKVMRVLLVYAALRAWRERAEAPAHAVVRPRLAGHVLDSEQLVRAMLVILVFVLTVVMSWLPFLHAGIEPLAGLFEVVSAVCTAGLSAGVTQPSLPDTLKIVLCIDMWLGRVEILAMVLLLLPRTWFGSRLGDQ